MTTGIGHSIARWTLNCLGAALLIAGTQSATAQAVSIYPTVTSITSTADRMISYRNQQHSWQTSDGAIHLMVNRGSMPTGDSLALFSSFDNGATWFQEFSLPDTDAFSTSDGALVTVGTGSSLLIAYATSQATGNIMYVAAAYNGSGQTWTLAAPQTAVSTASIAGSNPAFAMDSLGNVWCGFTAQNRTTLTYQEMMVYRPAKSLTWYLTSLVFGGSDASLQRSSRPVPYTGGVGMIYQSGASMYWAHRPNGALINAPWDTVQIYTGLPPYSQDPYNSHYSVIADAQNNLHLAFIANQQLLYMRYISSTGLWGAVRPLTTSAIMAAYPQTVLAGGNLVIMVNNMQSAEVLQSTDNGNTFTLTQALLHTQPPPGSALYYGNPRLEAPGRSTSPIPTFQQFVNGPIEQLMYFQVPVIPKAPVTK